MKGLVGAALMVSETLLKLVPFEIFHVPVRKISVPLHAGSNLSAFWSEGLVFGSTNRAPDSEKKLPFYV